MKRRPNDLFMETRQAVFYAIRRGISRRLGLPLAWGVREMVLSKDKGLIRDKTYRIRLYGADELVALTRYAGFDEVRIHTDASAMNPGGDVGCMNHRLVVSARKF